MEYGNIIPSKCIGSIHLGMNMEQVNKLVSIDKVENLQNCYVLQSKNIKIWINKENDKVTQVLVEDKFKGKYKDVIGIGSTLQDIQNKLKLNWYEDLDCYFLHGIDGICFELGDSGNNYHWYEEIAPIVAISVFSK